MKRNILIATLLTCLSIQTCDDHNETADHSHEHHSEASANDISKMKLNSGAKWEMDLHTRTMIHSMAATFKSSDHQSIKGLHTMAAKLQSQLSKLITGCTMQGASHDQLHIILPPITTTIKKIEQAQDLAEARKQTIKLKGLFTQYDTYFK